MLMRFASIVAIATFALSASAENSSVVTPTRVPPLATKRIYQSLPREVPHPVQLTSGTDLGPSEFANKQKVLQQKLSEQDVLQRQIEQLRRELQAPQQILVRVRMLEVSHTKMRKIGLDANLLSKGYLTAADGDSLRAAVEKIPASSLIKPMVLSDHNTLQSFTEFLVKNNIGRVLAEPTLSVLAGRPAQFNVGGEFAIPAKDGSTAAVEFRPYGTTMDVLATSNGGNVIRMELRIRVSELDESHSFRFGAASVPGLSVRQIDTSVETRANESVALCGMAERGVEKNKNTQTDRQSSDDGTELTEMLVVVTPDLVQSSN